MQKDMDMENYIKEFQKLCLRSGIQEEEPLNMARYLGGLKQNIQEEISLLTPTIVHKCFQLSLKVEDKNKKKEDSKFKGRGRGKDGRNKRGYGGRGSNSNYMGTTS